MGPASCRDLVCVLVRVREGGVVRVRMRVRNVYVRVLARGAKNWALPQKKNEWNKCKNHFYEMKGDIGMSLHEKERNKKMPIYTKTQSHS